MANADAWGNLQQSGTHAFQVPADANNRFNGYVYDAAGNMTVQRYVHEVLRL